MNPSRSVVYEYTNSPLFHCHRSHGLAGCRLVLPSEDSILPVVIVVLLANNLPPSVV